MKNSDESFFFFSSAVPPVVVYNDEWTWDNARRILCEDQAFDNIVISPGPGSPECPGDIGLLARCYSYYCRHCHSSLLISKESI